MFKVISSTVKASRDNPYDIVADEDDHESNPDPRLERLVLKVNNFIKELSDYTYTVE